MRIVAAQDQVVAAIRLDCVGQKLLKDFDREIEIVDVVLGSFLDQLILDDFFAVARRIANVAHFLIFSSLLLGLGSKPRIGITGQTIHQMRKESDAALEETKAQIRKLIQDPTKNKA